jgi:hypothetical protein
MNSHTHTLQEPMRKITVHLPAQWLEDEMTATGLGVTDLLRQALKEMRHRRACREVLKLRGKVKWTIPYEQIKAERE